jgi:GNAT superfamily N-acetyltransferase
MRFEPDTSGHAVPAVPVTVRAVAPEDLPRVWELVRELARYEKLEAILTNTLEGLGAQLFEERWPRVECLVAETTEEIVGYAIFFGCWSSFRGAPVLWLEDLHVSEARRGIGAGHALFAAVARIAHERGCVRMDWDVLDWNDLAIGFYERHGARHATAEWSTYSLDRSGLEAMARATSPLGPAPSER